MTRGWAARVASWAPAMLIALAPWLSGFSLLERRNPEVEAGNAALKAGKPEEALPHYDKAIATLPGDAGAHFDRGAALYALSRFEEAGEEFLRATAAGDGALKQSAFFNLGNAFFKKEKFKEAVDAYKRALALRPDDQQAKWNLEIALRKQKDQEEKQKKDQNQNKDDKNKDDKKKDDQAKNDKQNDEKKKNQENQEKKDDKKEQDKQKQAQKDQKQDEKQQQQQQQQQQAKQQPADNKEIEAVLDNLERSSKDLEKQRAQLRAVRRAPPAKDW
jgi:tetratricopeptide (TPR) repeat protein